jgi:class 3 adenylate cyclase/pimeloyl-ACP methyl ester carboxylesterase
MKCPQCEFENRPQAKFCEQCATPLARACSNCGTHLSATAKFCPECAHPVSSPSAVQSRFHSPRAYTPKHLAEKILTSKSALEGERKQVTVPFADMKGSMELLADRDPEEARKFLDPVLEHMMEAVHRYEGTVNQVMGDGIMALFGAPLAHEDHALRACYAALRMQESVKRYTEGVRRTEGIPIQIRVGLNSGEVVVRSIGSDLKMDYTAVGQTTHLAARMEQMAVPGSILIAADTLRLAEGFVQLKSLGPVKVKGMGEPVEVYEVAGAGVARTRLQAAAARGLSRFVGRDAEVEQLFNALDQAGAGHGQVVSVVGEPGVGKSRLFYEFTNSHRTQQWLIIESSSVSYGKATPYLPMIDLLKNYFHVRDGDAALRVREKVIGKILTLDERLKDTISPILSLLDVLPEQDPFRSLDPPQHRGHVLDALRRLFVVESQRQPLLLVFEDLHWIDSETQILLDSIIESLPTARLFLLVNYRPEYQHSWARKTYYTQIRLDPLAPVNAGELLQAILGNSAALQPLKNFLIERTEGNPFFLEESVRTLVETGVLRGERGVYDLAKAFEAMQIPATVQAVLTARIDRLPAEEKRLLQTAAVIGKDVPFGLLQAITDLPDNEFQPALTNLQASEFLYETNLFPDLEYTFKHALTHQVAYESLLHERRRQFHRRVGEAIEEHYPDRLSELAETLAHHFERAEMIEKAVEYYLIAADKAKASYAYQTAAGLCDRSMELVKGRSLVSQQIRGLMLQGDLFSLMDDLDRANQTYERALEVSKDDTEKQRIANKRHRPHSVIRNGARIVFYEHGSGGHTLIITNPFLSGLETFQPVIERLCQEFQIITIDHRGTGGSDPLVRPYTLIDHMEDVRAVIEASTSGPVVAIGVSKGGRLIVKLAHAYPSLVNKMVIVGSGPQGGRRASSDEYRTLMEQGNVEAVLSRFASRVFSEPGTNELVAQRLRYWLRYPLETVLSFFDPDPENDITAQLPEVRIPTLVMHGTADRTAPFEAGSYLAQNIPRAQFYPFKDKGHLPIFTATSEFCEVLRCFVRTGYLPEKVSSG